MNLFKKFDFDEKDEDDEWNQPNKITNKKDEEFDFVDIRLLEK